MKIEDARQDGENIWRDVLQREAIRSRIDAVSFSATDAKGLQSLFQADGSRRKSDEKPLLAMPPHTLLLQGVSRECTADKLTD